MRGGAGRAAFARRAAPAAPRSHRMVHAPHRPFSVGMRENGRVTPTAPRPLPAPDAAVLPRRRLRERRPPTGERSGRTPRSGRIRRAGLRVWSSPIALTAVFLAVHVWLGAKGITQYGRPFGDVTSVYHWWSYQALAEGHWYGILETWVYPAVALAPMAVTLAIATVLGVTYTVAWLILVTALDLLALAVLTDGLRDTARIRVAWLWPAALLALGAVSLGRIDTVALALVVMALSLLDRHPAVAGLLLVLGAWIKVWPAAVLLAALAVHGRERRMRRGLVLPGVWLTAGLAVLAAAASAIAGRGLSGLAVLFGFIGGQASRNLQVEAVAATPGLWAAHAGHGAVVYNDEIYTNELISASSPAVAAVVTVLMAVVAAAIAALAWRAARPASHPAPVAARQRDPARREDRARTAVLLAWTVLALVVTFIVCNKVGSPQFEGWLIAPALLLAGARPPRWWAPVGLIGVVLGLTQTIYPSLYGWLLGLAPWMLWVITARNALLVVLLGWSIVAIAGLACRPAHTAALRGRSGASA